MKNKIKRRVVILATLAILGIGYYTFHYNFVFSRQITIAELVNIDGNLLVFKTRGGDQISAKGPSILLPFLEEGKFYSVAVYSNKFREPFIKDIKVSP